MRAEGIDVDADDFLVKPVNFTELVARCRSLIRLKRHTDDLESAEALVFSLAGIVEARYASLIRNASDVIMIAASDGRLRFVSPAAERTFAAHPDDLVGRSLGEQMHVVAACGQAPDEVVLDGDEEGQLPRSLEGGEQVGNEQRGEDGQGQPVGRQDPPGAPLPERSQGVPEAGPAAGRPPAHHHEKPGQHEQGVEAEAGGAGDGPPRPRQPVVAVGNQGEGHRIAEQVLHQLQRMFLGHVPVLRALEDRHRAAGGTNLSVLGLELPSIVRAAHQ